MGIFVSYRAITFKFNLILANLLTFNNMSYLWITPQQRRETALRSSLRDWLFPVESIFEPMGDDSHHNSHHCLTPMQLLEQAMRPGTLAEHQSLVNPVKQDANGNRQLQMTFDVRNFKPEEVQVTLDTKKRCISVEASHEEHDDKKHSSVKRHYWRSVHLPEQVIDDVAKLELKSSLHNGTLSLEAPLPKVERKQIEEKKGPTEISVKKV